MKKLLILFALIMLIYYTGAKAQSQEWKDCVIKTGKAEEARAIKDPEAFTRELCEFYKKPWEECVKIIESAHEDQLRQIVGAFFLQAKVIPACGTPSETK